MGIIDRIWHRLQATLHGVCGRVWFRLRLPLRARPHFERALLLRGEDFATYVYLGRIAFACGDYAGWRRELRHAHHTNPERFARLDFAAMNLGQSGLRPRLAGTGIDARLLPFDLDDTAARATWATLLAPGAPRGDRDAGNEGVRGQAGGTRARQQDGTDGFSDGGFSSSELDALLPDVPLRDQPLSDGPHSGVPPHDRDNPFADARRTGFGDDADRNHGRHDFGSRDAARMGDDFLSSAERNRFAGMRPIRPADLKACDVDDLLRRLIG